MSGNTMNTPEQRIGMTLGAILKTAEVKEVLATTGVMHDLDKNVGAVVKFRRFLPYGGASTNANTINRWSVDANAHQIQEGVQPIPDKLDAVDYTVTMKYYGAVYYYTNFVQDMYEDDIPKAQKMQLGQRMGLVREKIREGALRGCTNRYYAGGTSRATVDGKITMDALYIITQNLKENRAEFITSVVKAGPNFNTAPVEPSFIVYVSPSGEADVRNLPGFTKVVEYGSNVKPFHPLEIGAVDNYRFIIGPELATIPNAGAAVGSTGLYSTGGTYIDIVPYIIVAADAWGDVALKGMRAAKITHLKPNQIDKSDVLGLKGYCGAMFPSAMFVQNDGWMAILEAGRTARSA
jgi:N4-gp56 family major capsid protein